MHDRPSSGRRFSAASAGAREKRLQSDSMGSNRFRIDIPQWVEYYRQGRLDLDSMVTRCRPFDEINEAFADMKAGKVVGQSL